MGLPSEIQVLSGVEIATASPRKNEWNRVTIGWPSISQFLCPENGRMVEESPLPSGSGRNPAWASGRQTPPPGSVPPPESEPSRRIGIIDMGEAMVR